MPLWVRLRFAARGLHYSARRVIGHRGKIFFVFPGVSDHFESIETLFVSKIFMNLALHAKRVMSQRGTHFFGISMQFREF